MRTSRRTSRSWLIALAAATVAYASSAQRLAWNQPIRPFHIVGNIYFIGTRQLGSYLIAGSAGHILLDGALPESAPQIERNIETLGFRLKDVRILLNSHAHYDHAGGGLAELKRATGARMVASRGDTPDLEAGLTESFGAGWDSRMPPVKVDRVIRDGDQVSLGNVTLTAHVMPGHTRGCTTWTTTAAESGKTYQVVFYCSTSIPGYKLLHNRSYPSIADDYRHSFALAESLPCDVFLANHTAFFHMEEKLRRVHPHSSNPFIDPAEYKVFVAQSKADFERRLATENRSADLLRRQR